MYNQTTRHRDSSVIIKVLISIFIAVSGGFAISIVALIIVLLGFSIAHSGEIYPGISVGGISVSDKKLTEAIPFLSQNLPYPENGNIVFEDGNKMWVAQPADLGLSLDPANSVQAAYNFGRHGNPFARLFDQFRAWYKGYDISPLLVFDQRIAYQYLEKIAAEINRPTVEASLSINGIEVIALPGQVGRSLDIAATLIPLENQLRNMTDGLIPLVIHEIPPRILDVSQQAETARRILSQSLVLQVPEAAEGDPGPWTIDRQALGQWLMIQPVDTSEGERYNVGLDSVRLRSFLEEIAPQLDRYPANSRFIFNDETRKLEVIQPAVNGRSLNIDETILQINQKISGDEHTVSLILDYSYPQVGDDATGEKLGITELVSARTTYFYGSSSERIQNIKTAAARFHGVLLPPGTTFSMAEVLGDVSLDNGYSEALIIFGNRTIKGVGGGVCQVSTTLFRTAFFGGYTIVERHPHAYRVTYYELTRGGSVDTEMAGLDATVFVPVVDFKFTNDTPYWLLMETYVNATARSLTWKFYSTSDGRTVEWETTGLQNIIEPKEPIFQENPELAKNEVRQVDWEVEGADITVNRTVYKNGQIYFEDAFYTHYIPWQAVYEYGPGTKTIKLKKQFGD